MKQYWIYALLYYASWPIRAATGKLLVDQTQWCLKYLFPNEHAYMVVMAIARHESGDNLTSGLATNANNLFGMGVSANSPYQDGSYQGVTRPGEPTFASYSNVMRSCFDFYDWVYRRRVIAGRHIAADAFNQAPTGDYVYNSDTTRNFTALICGALAALKYFTQDVTLYVRAVYKLQDSQSVKGWQYRTSNTACVTAYGTLAYYTTKYFLKRKANASKAVQLRR